MRGDFAMNQALLVIDAQQELIDGNAGQPEVHQKDRLLSSINQVIQKALEAKVEIVFVRDTDVSGGTGSGFEIHSDIQVPPTATIMDKSATNCFYGTPLASFLDKHEIGHIVVMGCKTENCIDTAVRTATVQNRDVTLVGDGHSTTGNTILTAEQIIGHHNKILHGHDNVDNFSLVRNSHEDLFNPTHNNYR